MKYFLLLFIIPFSIFSQDGLRQQYQFNYLSLNPAFTGESGGFNAVGIIGNQFNGTVQFNQVSQVIAIDGQLYKDKNSLGFQGFRSNYGTFITSGATISYAYRININDLKVKLGANTGIINIPYFNASNFTQNVKPYFGIGGLFNYDGFTAGFSAPMFFSSKSLYENQPFLTQLMYSNDVNNQFGFACSGLLEFDNKESTKKQEVDLNLNTWFASILSLGISYRTYTNKGSSAKHNAWVPTLQVKLGDYITVGAAYNSNSFFNTNSAIQNSGTFGVFQLLIRYNSTSSKQDFGVLKGF